MTFHPDPGFGHADNCGGGNKPVMGSQLSTLDNWIPHGNIYAIKKTVHKLKVIDLVDPYLPTFLYSLYIYIYIIKLFLVLNIAEILLTGR
jgi:hypothetical protein